MPSRRAPLVRIRCSGSNRPVPSGRLGQPVAARAGGPGLAVDQDPVEVLGVGVQVAEPGVVLLIGRGPGHHAAVAVEGLGHGVAVGDRSGPYGVHPAGVEGVDLVLVGQPAAEQAGPVLELRPRPTPSTG